MAQAVACWAHNPKVEGSKPSLAKLLMPPQLRWQSTRLLIQGSRVQTPQEAEILFDWDFLVKVLFIFFQYKLFSKKFWTYSSVGQSTVLIKRGSQVRALLGLNYFIGSHSSAGQSVRLLNKRVFITLNPQSRGRRFETCWDRTIFNRLQLSWQSIRLQLL